MYNLSGNIYGNSLNYDVNLNIRHTVKRLISELKDYINSFFNKNDEKYILLIKQELSKITNVLEQIPDLSREFLDFLKIKKMLIYVLDNWDSMNSNDLNIVFSSIPLFSSLISVILNSPSSNYVEEYDLFNRKLREIRAYFNKNIYQRSDKFDDSMIKVSKILME